MDIRVTGPEPTAAERFAVDAVLGPPESAWAGGKRNMALEGRISLLGGGRARAFRDRLLPAFHAVKERFGWIPPGAFNYICKRLTVPPAEAYGVATFYHLFSMDHRPPTEVHVCEDIACRIKGSEGLHQNLVTIHGGSAEIGIRHSPCLGLCERAPAALILRAGEQPTGGAIGCATVENVQFALDSNAFPDQQKDWLSHSVPQLGQPQLRLLARVGNGSPDSIAAYQATGGFYGLTKALAIGPLLIINEVIASGLMGRGGAAFPTGKKWEAVAQAKGPSKYVVCNADESEPGTFKDRVLMEGDPLAVLEGMAIAGIACGATKGYIYIRGEYPLAVNRMQNAIDSARAGGWLGNNIQGTDYAFDIEIRKGAGAYICGEETALFNSIEGMRGEPRNKPPYPVHFGLFGKPTVINNVETLANIPWILRMGGAEYAGIGTGNSKGQKLFCVSGHVTTPGVFETPFGITLRQLITLAGGTPTSAPIKAILLGGAAGSFVGPDQLDVPLTFEGTRAIGASLGSGVVMVFDETTDLGDILVRIAAFFRDESCGQCVPCRVGVTRQEELVNRLRLGQPKGSVDQEVSLLGEIAQVMRDASICGLGHTASGAIQSALRIFGTSTMQRENAKASS